MKIASFHVKEFRSVWDSGPIKTDTVTCLVGKNEAGKTALLKALYRLNPLVDKDSKFDVTDDYPRRERQDYLFAIAANERKPAIVIEATFKLEDDDKKAVAEVFGDKALTGDTFTVSKEYENQTTFSLSFDEDAARNFLSESTSIPEELQTALHGASDWPSFLKVLSTAEASAEVNRLKELVGKFGKDGAESYALNQILGPRTPKFLYFDDYYQMTGRENVQALIKRKSDNALKKSDFPLIGLINLARLKLEDLLNTKRTVALNSELESAGNHLTKKILPYWSQNKHLKIKFDVREAKPEDPEDMREGHNIWGQIEDTVHWATTELSSRSKGFVWFFSFLAWYEDVKRQKQNVILLLDEPGLSLHGRAQGDLLRYIEEQLAPHHQVIYTTHSPFMVDSAHFERVRIVQDKGIDSTEALTKAEDGTKILTDVFDASEDSLFPLQGALGYDIHQTLFVGPNSVVVEGAADLLYIKSISSIIERKGGTGLSEKWTVTPVGGAGKVPTFVALLAPQKGMNIATLIDIQAKDREMVEGLYKKKLLEKKRVLTYADFTGAKEADVEDMFERDFYLSLVNAEFAKTLQAPIKMSDLNSHLPRILTAVEEHLEKVPLKSGSFGHFRPARYFSENLTALESKISDATLKRFEAAFESLNALL